MDVEFLIIGSVITYCQKAKFANHLIHTNLKKD